MSQPDLLSEQIEAFREALFGDGRRAIKLERDALVCFDGLVADFVDQARTLEARAATADGLSARCERAIAATATAIERAEHLRAQIDGPPPLDRVIADLDDEARATEAFTASIARTKERIVELRAAQDVKPKYDGKEKAILEGVESGKVALFPMIPRPALGDLSVAQSLDFLTLVVTDAPKSRFDDAPNFDNSGDCA